MENIKINQINEEPKIGEKKIYKNIRIYEKKIIEVYEIGIIKQITSSKTFVLHRFNYPKKSLVRTKELWNFFEVTIQEFMELINGDHKIFGKYHQSYYPIKILRKLNQKFLIKWDGYPRKFNNTVHIADMAVYNGVSFYFLKKN